MKFDRNIGIDGVGKYALLNLRTLRDKKIPEIEAAVELLSRAGVIEWGRTGEKDEFFVVKLRDMNSTPALLGYATAAERSDAEWAAEVRELASRSGENSPFKKLPD